MHLEKANKPSRIHSGIPSDPSPHGPSPRLCPILTALQSAAEVILEPLPRPCSVPARRRGSRPLSVEQCPGRCLAPRLHCAQAGLLGKGTLAVSPAGALPLPVPSLSALTTQNTRAEWCAQADKGHHPKRWAHPPGPQLSISGPHRGMLLSLYFLSLEEVRLKNACTALT